MSLLSQLQQANYQGIALQGGQALTFAKLLSAAAELRQCYRHLAGQPVALPYHGLPEFIATVLALDGWCSAVYLQPETALPLPAGVAPFAETQVTAAAVAAETQWFIATSGTTGTPKWIGHSLTSLTRAVKHSAASRQLCWGLCYQPYRFAGLQVVLQSLLSGACLTDCSHGDALTRLDTMQKNGVNAVSATPSLWRQFLMTGQLHQLRLKQLTLGGEIADQPLLTQLGQLFPAARLLHIYASTEAGVGFAVADQHAGFPARWLETGAHGVWFKIDQHQHLWLKPPQQPQNIPPSRLDPEGFIDTEDQVQCHDDRVFFLGRAGGVINVGGNKVHPEQVEQVLLQVTGVLQAHVYGKASSVLGQLVVADILPAPATDTAALQKTLLAHCLKQLERYQIPTRFHWVDHVATGHSGKLNRRTQDV